MTLVQPVASCRFCGGALSIGFCDLGLTPLANSFVAIDQADTPDPVFPLNAVVCEACFLVQLDHVVDASAIFSDYAYFSSYSSTWLEHAAAFVRQAIPRHALGRSSFVVEVASNDGYLLRNLVAEGIPCLGVEPAANVAAAARDAGVPTEVAFLTRALAERIVVRHGHADLVIANNVLAHVPDINDFVAALAILAGPRGAVSIEAPHLLALIEQTQFDTIYHEHYAYWSLHSMEQVLAAHGLPVRHLEVLPTHGTSLRVLASADPKVADRCGSFMLDAVRSAEQGARIDDPATYRGFETRVATVISGFRDYLARARRNGRRIAAYGAAAKGNTFLNACQVTARDIICVADRNPAKQGRLLPGSRIPIVTPEAMLAERPDDVLILPWNLADEIAGELRAVPDRGGRLMVAIPHLREIGVVA